MSAARMSPFAGTWYPQDAGELREILDRAFEDSRVRTGPHLLTGGLAFVAPHAAPIYSGVVAASVYRHFEGVRRVILLGFSHRHAHGGIAVPDLRVYETPLGPVEVDADLARRFPVRDLCDHSVDIQMPFLRIAAADAKVLPLYVGMLGGAEREEAAATLARLWEPGTVFLVSSDFTHYGRAFHYQPFAGDSRTAERLGELDQEVIAAAGSLKPALFMDALKRTGCTVCGYGPISLLGETLVRLGGEEIFQQTLDYQTSGEITGDYSHSVSYAGLGYFRAGAFRLEAEEQKVLLQSARDTLNRLRETGERVPVPPRNVTPALVRRAGVFVTLMRGGALRGCVGRTIDLEPLAQSVAELTLAAALDDSRFPARLRDEPDIAIAVTVLSPMKRVSSAGDVIIPDHGVHFEGRGHRGLLLPQVARERKWNREQLLDALAHKSGVADLAGGTLSVFRAQTFAER